MKALKRTTNDQNWRLEGDTITVRIPMTWKRHGGRKVIIAPDGSDAWAPAKPRQDETLIRALARAHRWCNCSGSTQVSDGDDHNFDGKWRDAE